MGTSKQKSANSVKRSKSQPRAKLKTKILKYWASRKTLFTIARLVGCRQPTVKQVFLKTYGRPAYGTRSIYLYRLSKLGKKNPMHNKRFETHHNWKGSSSDHKGYLTVVKPIWWTGRQKKRIFEHHLVYAKAHGMSYIPKGFAIHHKDGNKINNIPSNLQMLKHARHTAIHQLKRRVTTSRKT
jgi:hypothetical protein